MILESRWFVLQTMVASPSASKCLSKGYPLMDSSTVVPILQSLEVHSSRKWLPSPDSRKRISRRQIGCLEPTTSSPFDWMDG